MESKSGLIKKIIAFEWDMFQAVNEGGPRASCQNDPETFAGMRRGQFAAWSDAAGASYSTTLRAPLDGLNSYGKDIHMMKYSNPADTKSLRAHTHTLRRRHGARAGLHISWSRRRPVRDLSPRLGAGRPPALLVGPSGFTSNRDVSALGAVQLFAKTLEALRPTCWRWRPEPTLARDIHENSVRHYG
jgi:hypothetical protein